MRNGDTQRSRSHTVDIGIIIQQDRCPGVLDVVGPHSRTGTGREKLFTVIGDRDTSGIRFRTDGKR